jgi:DNA-binding LacI/PurR family transcriptional regulator
MASTIKDIAKKLKVSTSTVSYALNGGPRRVPDEVRQRVLETARELDYRPNRIARSLITRKSQVIGVVPDRPNRNAMLGPFLHLAINGVMNVAEERRYDLMLFSSFDSNDPDRSAEQLADNRIDAAIFVASANMDQILDRIAKLRLPFATVAMRHPEASVTLNIDNQKATRLAVEHLYGLGHTKIAHLRGLVGLWDSELRHKAFRETMGELGLTVREEYVKVGSYLREVGAEATKELLNLPEPPTAIFSANDEMAMGALDVCHEMGLEVPRQLSIVGVDDVPTSTVSQPPLTTVRQPIMEMGEEAARALIDLVEERETRSTIEFEPELVVRQSTGAPLMEVINR